MPTPATDSPVRVVLPSEPQYARIARLVASGMGTLAGFDLDAIEDLRISIDELFVELIELGDGSEIEIEVSTNGQHVEASGHTRANPNAIVDEQRRDLARQILRVACAEHRVTVEAGSASFWLRTHDVG